MINTFKIPFGGFQICGYNLAGDDPFIYNIIWYGNTPVFFQKMLIRIGIATIQFRIIFPRFKGIDNPKVDTVWHDIYIP